MTKTEQQLRMHMINLRLKHDWSVGEVVFVRYDARVHGLRYRVAMQRTDEIINKMMRII